MRNKRLIGKINLTLVFVVCAIVFAMSISYAAFLNSYNVSGDISSAGPNFTVKYNNNTTATQYYSRSMSPMSDSEARIGKINMISNPFKSGAQIYSNSYSFLLHFNPTKTYDKDTYIGLITKYSSLSHTFDDLIQSLTGRRIKDKFVKFDVKYHKINSNNTGYESDYLIKGQSFENLDDEYIAYYKVGKGETNAITFEITMWISDDVTICDDGTCSYTTTQFSNLKCDLTFEMEVIEESDIIREYNTTDVFNYSLSSLYSNESVDSSVIGKVEEILFKTMPKENILNRYNNSNYKVMIDDNTYSWLEKSYDNGFYRCYVASDKTMRPSNNEITGSMFSNFQNLRLIDFGYNVIDTSNVTEFNNVFKNCYRLQYIKGFNLLNFSNCKEFTSLFVNCYSLVHIEFNEEYEIKPIGTYQMFFHCFSISILDLNMFDFSTISNCTEMFRDCCHLLNIYCKTDLSGATFGSSVFAGCSQLIGNIAYDSTKDDITYGNNVTGYFLEVVDTKNMATSRAFSQYMWQSFFNIVNLSGVTNVIFTSLKNEESYYNAVSSSFKHQEGDIYAWLSNLDNKTVFISSATSYLNLYGDEKISSNSNIKNVGFYNCYITQMNSQFKNLNKLRTIDLGFANTSSVDYTEAFYGLTNCVINTYDLRTERATNFSGMFKLDSTGDYFSTVASSGRGASDYINLNYICTNSLTNMSNLFERMLGNVSSGYGLHLVYDGINAYNVTNISGMFRNTIFYFDAVIPNIGLYNVTNMSQMFSGSGEHEMRSLKLDITNMKFLTDSPIDFSGMFYDLLFDVMDISGFNTGSLSASPIGYDDVFMIGCQKLIAKNCDFRGLTSLMNSDFFYETYIQYLDRLMIEPENIDFDLDEYMGMGGDVGEEYLYIVIRESEHWGMFAPSQVAAMMLESVDFSNSYFSNSISGLLFGMYNLKKANFYNVDTSTVTDMSYMFMSTSQLKNLDLSSFNYKSCKDLSGMLAMKFYNTEYSVTLKNLTTTGNVEKMSHMFMLSLVPISFMDLNTSSVRDFSFMFAESQFFEELDYFDSFYTGNGELFTAMFYDLVGLTELNLMSFDIRNGINFDFMFTNCSCSDILVSDKFINTTGEVPYAPFYNCGISAYYNEVYNEGYNYDFYSDNIDTFMIFDGNNDGLLTLGSGVVSNINNYIIDNPTSQLSTARSSITSIVFEILDYDEFDSLTSAYDICDNGWDCIVYEIEDNVLYIYGNERYVKEFNLPINCDNMFKDFSSLTSFEGLEYVNAGITTSMNGMFMNCSSLEEFDIYDWECDLLTETDSMFEGCTHLEYARLSGLESYAINSMESMFKNCTALKVIDISGLETSSLETFDEAFYGCTNLKMIFVNDNWDSSNITGNNTFYGCANLYSMNYNGDYYSYSSSNINSNMAKITNGSNNGYLSNKINYMIRFDEIDDFNINDYSTITIGNSIMGNEESEYYDVSLLQDNSIRLYYNGTSLVLCTDIASYFPIDCSSLFEGASSLSTITLSKNIISTKYTRSMNSMFKDCTSLYSGVMNSDALNRFYTLFDTSSCVDMEKMFYNLRTGSVSFKTFDFSRVSNINQICANCTRLNLVDFDGAKFGHSISFDKAFYGCEMLNMISVGNDWDDSYASSAIGTFDGVSSTYFNSYYDSRNSYTLSEIMTYNSITSTDGNGNHDWLSGMTPSTSTSKGMFTLVGLLY